MRGLLSSISSPIWYDESCIELEILAMSDIIKGGVVK